MSRTWREELVIKKPRGKNKAFLAYKLNCKNCGENLANISETSVKPFEILEYETRGLLVQLSENGEPVYGTGKRVDWINCKCCSTYNRICCRKDGRKIFLKRDTLKRN